ncbi:hypothetical protein [Pontibacter roseus]|uniref:hypothetical protein n=1 Tax=Pontibacter roseus TaxID=336989 RepID=UPI00036CAF68|nr:hypothetical protein [Pontibacter roseus]
MKKAKLADRLLNRIGRLYLHRRHRSRERVERELRTKYEGEYRNAGLVLLFDLVMAFAVVAVVLLLAGVLYLVTV